MNRLIFIIFFIPHLLFSQEAENNNVWEPLQYFVGEWEGQSTGKAGEGNGERIYKFIMNNTYLYYQNTMKFEPQEKRQAETSKDSLSVNSLELNYSNS